MNINRICIMVFSLLGLFSRQCFAAESVNVSFANARYNDQPSTTINARLTVPTGTGLFPVVVVLQACGGLDDNVTVDWPQFLGDKGYATLIPDILGSRGVKNACDQNPISLDERMRDVYGAIAFAANHPQLDRERIHILGFSWGGTHVLEALLERRTTQFLKSESARVRSGIAIYPGCSGIAKAVTERNVSPSFYAPALIIGAQLDDWTPVELCRLVVTRQKQPPKVRLEVVLQAHHGFDQFTNRGQRLSLRQYLGHTMEPSQAATDIARRLAVDFLAESR